MEGLLRRLARHGLRRGLRSGSRVWLLAGGLAWLVSHMRRGPSEVVFSEELKPGNRLVIDHLTETAAGGRRRRPGNDKR